MKRSLLRFLTSVYIMIVSIVLIIISAYAWITISDAPVTRAIPMGVAGRDEIGLPEKDYAIWNGTYLTDSEFENITVDSKGVFVIRTAEEFATVIRKAGDATYTSDITMRLEADISLADLMWIPVYVDGGESPKQIKILGNGKELVCLAAPLFSGGAPGRTSITISDLTVNYSDIKSQNPIGAGALVEYVDSMQSVMIDSCHLINTNVTGQNVGGFIGVTKGYAQTGKDAIDTYVTVFNSTIENCHFKGTGTVGSLVGLVGADPATYTSLQDCTVTETKLTSTNPNYAGVGTILGTASVGEVYVIDCKAEGITEVVAPGLEEVNESNLIWGLEAYGTTGKMVIVENSVITLRGNQNMTFVVKTVEELANALEYAANPEFLNSVTINIDADLDMTEYGWNPVWLATAANDSGLTINGRGHVITNLPAPLLAGGTLDQRGTEFLVIRDLTIKDSQIHSINTTGNGAFIECVTGLLNVTLDNCHLVSSTITGDTTEGTRTGGLIGYTSAAKSEKNVSKDTMITVTNCSVVGSTLTSYGTVGGLIGHAGANQYTDHLIQDCTVSRTELISTEVGDGYKGVGAIVGTLNRGRATIQNCTSVNVLERSYEMPIPSIYENYSNGVPLEYGRLSLSTVGVATIINENGTMSFGNGYATFNVANDAGLRKAMQYLSYDGYKGTVTINLLNDITILNEWDPVLLATEKSSDSIVINGNSHSLFGLPAPLLEGGAKKQVGSERLVIQNLTIANSNMLSYNLTGNGAFIECVAGLQSVTMTNCHLIESKLNGIVADVNGKKEGPRTGGLIGWTSAGTDENGASIDTTVTLTGCSVQASYVNGYGTVGGMIGYAGYNSCMTHIIDSCSIADTTLKSTESPYKGVGTMVGTSGIALMDIRNYTADSAVNVTEIVPEISEYPEYNTPGLAYGRFAPSSSGVLLVNGVAMAVPTVKAPTTTTTTTTSTTPATGEGTTTPVPGDGTGNTPVGEGSTTPTTGENTGTTPETGETPAVDDTGTTPETGETPAVDGTGTTPETGETPAVDGTGTTPEVGDIPAVDGTGTTPEVGDIPAVDGTGTTPETGETPAVDGTGTTPETGETPAVDGTGTTPEVGDIPAVDGTETTPEVGDTPAEGGIETTPEVDETPVEDGNESSDEVDVDNVVTKETIDIENTNHEDEEMLDDGSEDLTDDENVAD